jgi:hypothetical protein
MCLLVIVGALLPRVTLLLLWLFTTWTQVLVPWWLGVLGFLFLPTTTLAFVCLRHYAGTVVLDNFAHLAVLVVGLVLDTGGWSGGQRQLSKRRE